MDFSKVFYDIATGLLVTDADFNVLWANKFEEDFYGKPIIGLWVVNCHQEGNRPKIQELLEKFKKGELKTFSKTAVGLLVTYTSYFKDGEFAGIVRTRTPMIDQT